MDTKEKFYFFLTASARTVTEQLIALFFLCYALYRMSIDLFQEHTPSICIKQAFSIR